MKEWKKPEVNSLNLGFTKDLQLKDKPHPWKCTTCGKHHELKPVECGYMGCKGTEFEWACNEPESIIS